MYKTNYSTKKMNYIIRLKKKNGKDCIIDITIKCLAHQWLTFTNEGKFDDYFNNMVKDTNKFKSFKEIQYYVSVQKPKK